MAKREREAADMAAMIERVLRSLARRAWDGDMAALEALDRVEKATTFAALSAVQGLRAEPHGYSWSDIGQALGVTRQAAQQRFGGPKAGAEG